MSETIVGELKTAKFKWEINTDCLRDKNNGEKLLSPSFSSKNNSIDKWQLHLYPNGKNKGCNGHVSLFVHNLSGHDFFATFSLSVLDKDNGEIEKCSVIKTYLFKAKGFGISWGFEKFMQDSDSYMLKAEKLIILCRLSTQENNLENQEEQVYCGDSCKFKEFKPGFERLFINKEFSDVIVTADKKSFKLHKCILSSCSTVFESMFLNNSKKKNHDTVEINDVKSEVLDQLFRYMYTGKVDAIDKIAYDLLIASEKYCIEGLKSLCEKTICNSIDQENVFKYYNFAVLNNNERLKMDTTNWMSLHLECLIFKEEFKTFGVQYPDLLINIMRKYVTM